MRIGFPVPPSSRLLILCGNGNAAVAGCNVFQKLLAHQFDLCFIEERNVTLPKVRRVLARRFRSQGAWSVLDFILLRGAQSLVRGQREPRCYEPAHTCADVNEAAVLRIVRRHAPYAVLTMGCSILGTGLLELCAGRTLNVHNGLTPRYRGTGNVWAAREGNFDLIGATVHAVDAGIDTGARLCATRLDPRSEDVSNLEQLDRLALERGAQLAAELLLEGHCDMPPDLNQLPDGYYRFPGLKDYLRARRRLRAYLATKGRS